jgi:uncharacterized repeat protein (TIGR01451 family)
VSNVRDQGVFVNGGAGLTINNGFNNFFNNGQPNSGFTEGAGTVSVDPLFINPAATNYRLQPGSLLINAGTNTPTGGLPSVDADNLPRIVGGTVDIGAYEASADLEIVKLASSASLNVGENLTYTLTVTNLGPYDAAGVVLTDPLPAGVTLQSATSSQGSCSGTSTVVCDLGVLTNGAAATVTITVIPQQAGTLTNTASVTSQIPDPASNNDTSSVGTTVNSNIPPITPPVVGDLSGGGCQMGGSTPGMAVPWGFLGLSLLLSTFLRKTKTRRQVFHHR